MEAFSWANVEKSLSWSWIECMCTAQWTAENCLQENNWTELRITTKKEKQSEWTHHLNSRWETAIVHWFKTPYLWRHTLQQKHAFTEDGCKCPFSSTTAGSSAVAPTLSRVNSHAFTIKALLHCTTPIQSTKQGQIDGNPTGLFGTHHGAKHIGSQIQWQSPTCTFGGRNKLYPTMPVDTDCYVAANIRACSISMDITIPDCSS